MKTIIDIRKTARLLAVTPNFDFVQTVYKR